MKQYLVLIEPPALDDLRDIHRQVTAASPANGPRWLDRLVDAILSLDIAPTRCGIAPESEVVGYEIPHLHFGRRMNKYRILFEIEGSIVHVTHVYHGARDH